VCPCSPSSLRGMQLGVMDVCRRYSRPFLDTIDADALPTSSDLPSQASAYRPLTQARVHHTLIRRTQMRSYCRQRPRRATLPSTATPLLRRSFGR